MQKFIKIFLINIIIIFIIIIGFEYFIYKTTKHEDPFIHSVSYFSYNKTDNMYERLKENGFYGRGDAQYALNFRRPVEYKSRNKTKPVLIFGCSFAWGARLDEPQTFHYKLSKLMKRNVYNRSMSCWGPQHMLYQVKREDFYKEIPEPEFIIYVYISNHIDRMYKYKYISSFCFDHEYFYLKYNEHKNNLIEEKRLEHIPYSRIINKIILPYIAEKQVSDKSFNLLEKYFIETRKEIEKHWKNVKFIILDYDNDNYIFNNYPEILNKQNADKLTKDGFTVIKVSELTDIPLTEGYYLDEGDTHPNEAAWNVITPLFVKKLAEYKLIK